MMVPPSLSEQRAFAYACKPFAAMSILSSSFVIYHLTIERPDKRKRMYHRLILAMNLNVIPQACAWLWGTWSMPAGTPHVIGALGNVKTCVAEGFLMLLFGFTVPYYYASLSVYSLVAVRNNFQEAKYKWIEKWIHLGAFTFPLALALCAAAKGHINPYGSVCFLANAPQGCELDPATDCQRGGDGITPIFWSVFFAQMVLYFVIPPMAMLFVARTMVKVQKDMGHCTGMKHVIESAKRQMLKTAMAQSGLYLLSFWLTYVFTFIERAYSQITGQILYNLAIFANCLTASQGVIIMLVYFKLQRKSTKFVTTVNVQKDGRPTLRLEHYSKASSSERSIVLGGPLRNNSKFETVSTIRQNAERRSHSKKRSLSVTLFSGVVSRLSGASSTRCSFHIFDGSPDANSPWAKFLLDQDLYDEEETNGGETELAADSSTDIHGSKLEGETEEKQEEKLEESFFTLTDTQSQLSVDAVSASDNGAIELEVTDLPR